jgi:1-deoxy-D-xylulose-5-phosphate reductoisomerase
VLNAANEVAVAAFLEGRIGFTAIGRIVEQTMDALPPEPVDGDGDGLDHVLEIDARARSFAERTVAMQVF